MKKTLAVILAVLMLFTTVSFLAFAEDGEEKSYYNIEFVDYDGTSIKKMQAEKGSIVPGPANPTREATDDYEYTFKGWSADGGKTLYFQNTIPIATADVTYTAVYSETEKQDLLTFWGFIASIFRRINMIYEYFYKIFSRGLEWFD